MADNFNPYYNDNRPETIARKELRFQEELKRHQKANNLGSQVAAKSIKATPSGAVAPSGGQMASVTGPTSQAAGPAIQNAAGNMALSKGADMVANNIDGGGTTTSTSGGAAGGALKGGMSMASTGNPYAIAGGAIVGGVTGALGARSNRKKKEAEAQAKMHQELGKIEGQKTERLNAALAGLADNFSRTLV